MDLTRFGFCSAAAQSTRSIDLRALRARSAQKKFEMEKKRPISIVRTAGKLDKSRWCLARRGAVRGELPPRVLCTCDEFSWECDRSRPTQVVICSFCSLKVVICSFCALQVVFCFKTEQSLRGLGSNHEMIVFTQGKEHGGGQLIRRAHFLE